MSAFSESQEKPKLTKGLGALAIIVSLLGILAVSVWASMSAWTAQGGPPIDGSIAVAMWFGIVFSLVVGCGLMALVFFSNRQGYDDRAYDANDRQ